VVVTHQPVMVTRTQDLGNRLHGREQAVARWCAAGADLILGGHIHLPFVRPLHDAFSGCARTAWAVQAGTAVSWRVRADHPNSVNVVRTDIERRQPRLPRGTLGLRGAATRPSGVPKYSAFPLPAKRRGLRVRRMSTPAPAAPFLGYRCPAARRARAALVRFAPRRRGARRRRGLPCCCRSATSGTQDTEEPSEPRIALGLASGFVLILLASSLFAWIASNISGGRELGQADHALTDAIAAHLPWAALVVFSWVTHLGDAAFLAPVCVAGGRRALEPCGTAAWRWAGCWPWAASWC
jgi:hypothetical protein